MLMADMPRVMAIAVLALIVLAVEVRVWKVRVWKVRNIGQVLKKRESSELFALMLSVTGTVPGMFPGSGQFSNWLIRLGVAKGFDKALNGVVLISHA
jgi:hypothetical protein